MASVLKCLGDEEWLLEDQPGRREVGEASGMNEKPDETKFEVGRVWRRDVRCPALQNAVLHGMLAHRLESPPWHDQGTKRP